MPNNFQTPLSSGSVESPSSAYDLTSIEEMERVYSSVGIDLRTEDMSSGDATTALNEVISAASETIASFTLRWYATENLAASSWIRRRATIIACYYLSMRRANGTQFAREYDRIIEELERFLTATPPMIPGDDGFPVPVRTSLIPTVSDYRIDDRQRYRKLRVNQEYSTKPYPGQYGYASFLSGDYM